MMNREEIVYTLSSICPAFEAKGVRNVASFGSRERGDFGSDSDLEILLDVDAQSKVSILGPIRVEWLTSEAVGVPANVFMRRSVDGDFMSSIKPDLVEVF
jgi:uncharacterized protein